MACLSLPLAAQTNFGSINVGSSATATVTVNILSAATLGNVSVRTKGAQNLNFNDAGGGSCSAGSSYTVNDTCTVAVTFKPSLTGTLFGAVVLLDNAGEAMGTAYLQGAGAGPDPSVVLSALPTTETAIFGGTPNAPYNYPLSSVAVDGGGNLYFPFGTQMLKETLSAGNYAQNTLSLNGHAGWLALDGAGNLYIASIASGIGTVYKETPTTGGTFIESTVATGLSGQLQTALDGGGNVYIADDLGGRVLKETLTAGAYTPSVIYTCGTAGKLSCPLAIAVDNSGDVFVSSYTSSALQKLTPSGGSYTVTNFGSSLQDAGGIAVDTNGNLLISEAPEFRIQRGTPSGRSYLQYTLPTGALVLPDGIAADSTGNVYVADASHGRILKEAYGTPFKLNFATTELNSTSTDSPKSITVSNFGNSRITFDSATFAQDFPQNTSITGDCTAGMALSVGQSCTLSVDFTPVTSPTGGANTLPLAETMTVTTTSPGAAPLQQTVDLSGTSMITIPESYNSINIPAGSTTAITISIPSADTLSAIAVRTAGVANLDFTNAGGGTCAVGTAYSAGATCTVKVSFSPTLIGPRYGAIVLYDSTPYANPIATIYLQGTGQGAQIIYPGWGTPQDLGPAPMYPDTDFPSNSSNGGIAFDGSGNLYVASQDYGLDPQGGAGVTKWAPSNGSFVKSAISSIGGPGIGIDGAGNLDYACGSTICKSTLLADGTYRVSTIGSGFNSIFGVALDGMGNVYASDDGTGILWKLVPQSTGNYTPSQIAGGLNGEPFAENGPIGISGVATDAIGNVYVANVGGGGSGLYKESPSGSGYTQTEIGSSLDDSLSVAVDRTGNVYVADGNDFYYQASDCFSYSIGSYDTEAVYEELLQPGDTYLQSTFPGDPLGLGYYSSPNVVAIDPNGNLYYVESGFVVANLNNGAGCNTVGELYRYSPDYTNPPSFNFGSAAYGSTSAPQVVTLSNSGNAPLTFSAITFPSGFVEDSAATTDCKVGKPVTSNRSCTLSIDFKPIAPLSTSKPFSGSVTFTSNSIIGSQQNIAVSGTELPFSIATPVFSPAPGNYSNALAVTITDTTPGTEIHYTLNGTMPTSSSTRYTGPVSIKNSWTLQAIAVSTTPSGMSGTASGVYQLVAAAPVANLASGAYSGVQSVTLTTASTGAGIHYTTNGGTPSPMSQLYTGPIPVSASETLKAIAVATGYTSSVIVTEVYTIH